MNNKDRKNIVHRCTIFAVDIGIWIASAIVISEFTELLDKTTLTSSYLRKKQFMLTLCARNGRQRKLSACAMLIDLPPDYLSHPK